MTIFFQRKRYLLSRFNDLKLLIEYKNYYFRQGEVKELIAIKERQKKILTNQGVG